MSAHVDGRPSTATVPTAIAVVEKVVANATGQVVLTGTASTGSTRLSIVDLRTRRVLDETPTLAASIDPSGNYAASLDFEGLHPVRANGSRRTVVIRDTRAIEIAGRPVPPILSIDVAEAFAAASENKVASRLVSVAANGLDWNRDGGLVVELDVADPKDPSLIVGRGRLAVVPQWRSGSVAIGAVTFVPAD